MCFLSSEEMLFVCLVKLAFFSVRRLNYPEIPDIAAPQLSVEFINWCPSVFFLDLFMCVVIVCCDVVTVSDYSECKYLELKESWFYEKIKPRNVVVQTTVGAIII